MRHFFFHNDKYVLAYGGNGEWKNPKIAKRNNNAPYSLKYFTYRYLTEEEKEELLPIYERDRMKFYYSVDNGDNYVEYNYQKPANIPSDCSITDIKIERIPRLIDLQYSLEFQDDYKDKEFVDKFTIEAIGDNSISILEKEFRVVKEGDYNLCTTGTVPLVITEKKSQPTEPKPSNPPSPPTPATPTEPVTPSNPGPGGYVPTDPVKTSEPPKIETFVEKEKPTPKTEKSEFTMSFTDIKNEVERKLPTILPRMGIKSDIIGKTANNLHLLETRLPAIMNHFAEKTETDINFWKKAVIEADRDKDEYIVIPSRGMVIPVGKVDKNDKTYANFLNGKNEDFYNYANNGAVELPGYENNNYGEIGNKVIGGHSSWWKYLSNRYKTLFQAIINLKSGTEIWVYKKNENGKYSRFVYATEESYNTSDADVSILKDTKDASLLTLFTCTPVGSDIGRWVVKAKFIEKY